MNEIPIGKLAATLGKSIDETVRAIKIKTFNDVIVNTRVDTGRLRGSWTTNVGSPGESPDRIDKIPQGVGGGQAQDEVMANVTADQEDYLSSNLPYSATWEERDGMIAKAVERVDRNIREAIQ